MMERLEEDAALDAAARVNTLENVRITFDHKVEEIIQEIVDLNFDLYKRITDDPNFGEVIKNHLFDQYLRAHRNAEKRGGSASTAVISTSEPNARSIERLAGPITHPQSVERNAGLVHDPKH